MINEQMKMQFIDDIGCSNSIRESYKMIFKKVEPLEIKFSKDLKDFNKEELIAVLSELKGRSYNSVHTKWGIAKKYLKHFKNPYVAEITSDDVKKNIIETEVRYVTREELKEKTEILPSYSHKALLFLLFDGVGGKAYTDICNLKYSDIDFETNKITLEDKVIEISDDTVELLKKAQKEDTVCKLLGDEYNYSFNDEYVINMNSPYVFKTRMLKSTEYGMTPYKLTGLQRRLDTLTKLTGLNHVNGKTLYYSGLVERYLKLEKRLKKRLSIQELDMFASVVGATTIQANTLYRAMQVIRDRV